VFVVDTAVLLLHPPHVVARVAGRLRLLPRWCAGLRLVRFPADASPAAGCVFTYTVADARLTLRATTRGLGGDPGTAFAAGDPVTHTTTGDGLTLTWTLSADTRDGAGAIVPDGGGAPAGAAPRDPTWLRARVEVVVDPVHPLAATRASLCRTVARRVPADLERLRALLDRYQAGRVADGSHEAGSSAAASHAAGSHA
jgi:hypothetical protein